ncbi:TlpA disulfide reductase family protein [Streptomyces sp. NPDC005195]|uniref:TlpA family protein disulfide reductase n=1 Tax=Streptomyces sp. NPDC005195 TaxID=3154561 RepID=UPI0033AEDBE0
MEYPRRSMALALVLLALTACAPQRQSGGSPASLLDSIPAADRRSAPDLGGATLDGSPVHLADYRGKVVVLNVWASWCGPCRAETPELSGAQKDLKVRGVQVLGVSTDADRSDGRAFQREHRLTYPSLHDPSHRQLSRLPKGYLYQALPFTLFIDRRGRIAAAHVSTLTEADVRRVTAPLLRESAR